MKSLRTQRGFTLIELLVVIGILALLAAITIPALNNIKRSDATVAATRQLLDDVARARQLAISRHTTNYMIFVPASFFQDAGFTSLPTADLRAPGTNLYDKQLIGYTFVTLRSVGEQPGQKSPDYIGPWRTMPENTFIATNKFALRGATPTYIFDPPGSAIPKYTVKGFERTTAIPFPSEDAYNPANPNRSFAFLPYLAFDHLGRLTSGQDEYIPIARGTVAHSRNAQTKVAQAVQPELIENPAGNSTNSYNLIHIDWLTGRARLEHQEISGL
ncbi:MAG: type II secretion system protein [Pedosphaera sp.]|nr:type II secretion system protein [Pedosphaera sp.]